MPIPLFKASANGGHYSPFCSSEYLALETIEKVEIEN